MHFDSVLLSGITKAEGEAGNEKNDEKLYCPSVSSRPTLPVSAVHPSRQHPTLAGQRRDDVLGTYILAGSSANDAAALSTSGIREDEKLPRD